MAQDSQVEANFDRGSESRPIWVLLGCTAVGKSAVAAALAERHSVEIVSVDSMQVYRGMDIGTAKPSPDLLRHVRHHLVDVADPGEAFTAARFVELADAAIADIRTRGRTPLLVAGTPFYLMSLLYGLFEGPSMDPGFRALFRRRATAEGGPALHRELAAVDPQAAARIHPNDLRRIERALEVFTAAGRPISDLQRQWTSPPRYAARLAGIRRGREDLARRINARVRDMVDGGLIDEVRRLLAAPGGMSPQARAALGYSQVIAHLEGRCPLDEAIERIKVDTRRFAKSQRTWFRKFTATHWVDAAPDDAVDYLARQVEAAFAAGD